MNDVYEEDGNYDKLEEIREDNIEAARKQQSKSRKRIVDKDAGSDK
ncbi:MAG: hypothetical protein ACJ71K_05430 [Nitrososphaeraceae archaeon]